MSTKSGEGLIDIVTNARGGLQQAQANLPRIAQVANLVIIVLAVWRGALHMAPLVQGWELILKRRAERERKTGSANERSAAACPFAGRCGAG